MRRVPGAFGLRGAAQRPLPVHGNQDILLEKYDEFYDFVENKIKEKGFIRITKEACLFICENG